MGPENLLFVSDDAVEAVLHKAIEHLPTGNVANLCLIGSRLSTLENNLAPRETVNVQALLALPSLWPADDIQHPNILVYSAHPALTPREAEFIEALFTQPALANLQTLVVTGANTHNWRCQMHDVLKQLGQDEIAIGQYLLKLYADLYLPDEAFGAALEQAMAREHENNVIHINQTARVFLIGADMALLEDYLSYERGLDLQRLPTLPDDWQAYASPPPNAIIYQVDIHQTHGVITPAEKAFIEAICSHPRLKDVQVFVETNRANQKAWQGHLRQVIEQSSGGPRYISPTFLEPWQRDQQPNAVTELNAIANVLAKALYDQDERFMFAHDREFKAVFDVEEHEIIGQIVMPKFPIPTKSLRLSPSEQAILLGVLKEKTPYELAAIFQMSVETVKRYLADLLHEVGSETQRTLTEAHGMGRLWVSKPYAVVKLIVD